MGANAINTASARSGLVNPLRRLLNHELPGAVARRGAARPERFQNGRAPGQLRGIVWRRPIVLDRDHGVHARRSLTARSRAGGRASHMG